MKARKRLGFGLVAFLILSLSVGTYAYSAMSDKAYLGDGELRIDSSGDVVVESGKSLYLGGTAKSSWGSVVSPMTDASGYVNPTDAGNYLRLYDAGYLRLGDATNAGDYYTLYTADSDSWYAGHMDTTNDYSIGFGSTPDTDLRLCIVDDANETRVVLGDAAEYDTVIVLDGNAQDFYIALDDSADDLLIGLGSAVATTPAISIDENLAITTAGDVTMGGTTVVLTLGDAGEEDATLLFDGNAQDFYVALDDTADDLLIGLGNAVGTTPAIAIDEGLAITTYADITMTGTTPTLTVGDGGNEDNAVVFNGTVDFSVGVDTTASLFEITNGVDLDQTTAFSIADSTLAIVTAGDVTMAGTTVVLTLGDAGNEDITLLFDGQSTKDFYIATDNADDTFIIGYGSTVGTDERIRIEDSATATTITLGDAVTAEDTMLVYDGNAVDFRIALDDSADSLEIGLNSTIETDERITIGSSADTTTITIGDAAEFDMQFIFDGNAQDFSIGLDDTADDFVVSLGTALGTTNLLEFDEDLNVTVSTSLKTPVQVLVTTETLTENESGKLVILNHATEFATTLPDVASSAGVAFHFFCALSADTGSFTIVTEGGEDTITGMAVVNGASIPADTEDTITFTAGASKLGDWVTLRCDGNFWYVSGQAQGATGIVFTKT